MNDKPSVATTESAKNPNGQGSTMSAMATGKHECGHPEFRMAQPHVVNPTSSLGCKILEQRG